jgi:hypothetical protein
MLAKKRQKLEDLASEIADMDYSKFTEGEDYASLTKRYSQQGKKAMDDTIGKVAARTGGLASSYATAAGNQAYSGYMEKLEDAARAMYDDQRQEKIDNFGIYKSLYDQEYQESRDTVADRQWDKQFDRAGYHIKAEEEDKTYNRTQTLIEDEELDLEKAFYYNANAYPTYADYKAAFPGTLITEARFKQIKGIATGMYKDDNKVVESVDTGSLSDTDKAILEEYNNIVKADGTPSPELKRRHDEILGLFSDKIADLEEKALKAETLEEVSRYILEIDQYDPEEAERIYAEWEKAHAQIDSATYWSGKPTNAGYKYDEKIFN